MVHPQSWPEDFDYAAKQVVIIGSGATAATILPAMAETAAHVTMLQRSPTYVVSLPAQDRIANGLRRILTLKWAYELSRWKNIAYMIYMYQLARRCPQFVKAGNAESSIRSRSGKLFCSPTASARRTNARSPSSLVSRLGMTRSQNLGLASLKSLFSNQVALSVLIQAGSLLAPIAGLTSLPTQVGAIGIIPLVKAALDYRGARREALKKHTMSWLYLAKQGRISLR